MKLIFYNEVVRPAASHFSGQKKRKISYYKYLFPKKNEIQLKVVNCGIYINLNKITNI